MARLHIFNPDTDYALASDSPYYTAPAHVVSLRRRDALIPALYASPGDKILLMDDPVNRLEEMRFYDITVKKGITVLSQSQIMDNPAQTEDDIASPWGWNRQIRHWLIETTGGDLSGIPSEAFISTLRELSHRRTTIAFLREIGPDLDPEIEIPEEIFNHECGLSSFRTRRKLYFKAPWSSSGRGILLTDDLEERHVEPWLRGIIRRQGSVMMEKAYERRLDFATEWDCRDGSANFLGYSVFNVSRRGKYQSNQTGTQEDLTNLIRKSAPGWNSRIIESQKGAIEKIIAPFYEGPAGIDMLVTEKGAIHPCVEINLRHTMGMVNLINTQNKTD